MTMELTFPWGAFEADLARDGGPFLLSGGLESAVLISLFTDGRALPEDIADGTTKEPRGWWGDTFAEVPGSHIGSRIWLTRRSGVNAKLFSKIESYAREALQWLTDDGVATAVNVAVENLGREGTFLKVEIQKSDASATRWSKAWRLPNAV